MIEMLMSLALAFGICFYALPAIIYVSNEKRLFDFPDDRKVHRNPVPALGGLAIYAGFITAFLLTVAFTGTAFVFQYLVAASLIIFFVGLKDDLLNISPFKKFLGQILAAAILVFKGGLVISSMDGILGIYELPPVASEAISMITIVVIINSFNLIDGIDGLAGSLSMVSGILFAAFFAINGDYAYACLATSLLGAVGAFLIFNYPPARIFMGDTGSLMIGLVNAVLVIRFIQTGAAAPVWSVVAAPAMGFALLFIPLFDTLRVFSFRILHGISPFTPDRNHIHHILLRFGWSHLKITLTLAASALLVAVCAWLLQGWSNNIILGILLGTGFAIVGVAIMVYHRRRRQMLQQNFPRIIPGKKKAPVLSVTTKKAAN
jgi:UDP-N-acetylmuramyl pentapeptide phosphotransferase/UDP-N-acetylglucosamine-1-phosphate transferase